MIPVDDGVVDRLHNELLSQDVDISSKMRIIFTLRNIGGTKVILALKDVLTHSSALLSHEAAYCLGQLQNKEAIPFLEKTLENENLNTMVRHEAGEALGAIGDPSALPILYKYKDSTIPEIAETCQVSIDLISWKIKHPDSSVDKIFLSVDPAPPIRKNKSIEELKSRLIDKNISIFKRYKALFKLRNINTPESALAITEAFGMGGALFDHELAYVLGQMAFDVSVPALSKILDDTTLHEMVRHEAAEGLGAIASDVSLPILEKYANDNVNVVKESCCVALDLHRYYNSNDLQYADRLS